MKKTLCEKTLILRALPARKSSLFLFAEKMHFNVILASVFQGHFEIKTK